MNDISHSPSTQTPSLQAESNRRTIAALQEAKNIMAASGRMLTKGLLTEADQSADLRKARLVIVKTLRQKRMGVQPALYLRHADLLWQDKSASKKKLFWSVGQLIEAVKHPSADRAIPMDIEGDRKNITRLILFCKQNAQPELALGMLDILENIDPNNVTYDADRAILRTQCKAQIQRAQNPEDFAPKDSSAKKALMEATQKVISAPVDKRPVAALESIRIIEAALALSHNKGEAALHLRRIDLISLYGDMPKAEQMKLAEETVNVLETVYKNPKGSLPINHPRDIGRMVSLAIFCQRQHRPGLSLRLLDIVEHYEPSNPRHDHTRGMLRSRCEDALSSRAESRQLQSIPLKHLKPARPGGISPTVVPPAIFSTNGPR